MAKRINSISSEDKALGKLNPQEFKTWRSVKSRCNPIYSGVGSYYQRQGTLACDRWINSFKDFLADMGKKPTPKHTIDRIRGSGNYEPSNCRWITQQEQAENIKSNRWLETKEGERKVSAHWSKKLELHPSTVCQRLRRGWSEEEALTTPSKRPHLLYELNGERLPLTDWAKRYKIRLNTLRSRLKDGWTLEKSLTIKPKRRFGSFSFGDRWK
jgi:hypothetical protein